VVCLGNITPCVNLPSSDVVKVQSCAVAVTLKALSGTGLAYSLFT